MAEPVQVEWSDGLICRLPLTTARGKVQVKRNHQPLATRKGKLAKSDLIEWQISYFGKDGGLIELGELLRLGQTHGLIKKKRLEALKREVIRQKSFFSDAYKVRRIATKQVFQGFQVIYKRHPILHKDLSNHVSIEIELKPKQKAVGAQPMVYIFIPIGNLVEHKGLIGRPANKKEVVKWRPSPDILFEVVRAFALASSKHRQDMLAVLSMILEQT